MKSARSSDGERDGGGERSTGGGERPGGIVAATGNPGKLAELGALLAGVEVVAQSAYRCPPAAETAVTFIENALIKARHACAHTGRPAIADDSGLEVDALGGAPGVRSARYAGDDATACDNTGKLLAELAAVGALDLDRRTARFRCALVFMRRADDPAPLLACGVWRGRIARAPAGRGGFGYDPVFVIDDGRTAAELTAEEKNRISHRGQALRQLREQLRADSILPPPSPR